MLSSDTAGWKGSHLKSEDSHVHTPSASSPGLWLVGPGDELSGRPGSSPIPQTQVTPWPNSRRRNSHNNYTQADFAECKGLT